MNIDPEDAITGEVIEVLALEKTVADTRALLEKNEDFRTFLKLQKAVAEKSAEVWKNVEKQMIENNVKKISGDWGYITIAERIGFDVDHTQLPAKFYKKVVDTTRLANTYKLEGKDIKGATVKWTKYLTKKIKLGDQ